MFDHFLAPEGGHPTWEENSIEKKNTRMHSHPSILTQHQQKDVVSKVQQRYIREINKMYSHNFIIDQSRNTLQLNYCAEPPTFWANQLLFFQLQVCDVSPNTYSTLFHCFTPDGKLT